MSTVLLQQAANALIDTPVPDLDEIVLSRTPLGLRGSRWQTRIATAATERTLERFRRRHQGLWVGGYVTVTTDGVFFSPNDVNRRLHPATDRHVPLRDITGVEVRFGVVTKIIDITSVTGAGLTVRCFGAGRVASTIRDAARR
ncbi:hypothetical protein [Georgenia faecalis]|uniref:YokE-like PH domain-containing protein n=1 Tax=Georgenia faecalis TaxID=2483799 RepID=A0ABV9DDR1_9MICO|nr:hypothetical protein [Georgenia faecalis]